MIEAKVIEDSIYEGGKRLTTLQLKFHRFILPEFATHRMFSKNASSSRAIPVAKMLQQVYEDPAMPVEWGKNQAGMQARELLSAEDTESAKSSWLLAAKLAAGAAETAQELEGSAERDHRGARHRRPEPHGGVGEEIEYLTPLLHAAEPDVEDFVNTLHIENCSDL